ncbi:hypothetical protein V5N11_026967 [Cardamine amara subsp. amara]|uniref:GRF-type domain-containing protein n=1 Tax=Cardamine amara subsp. amara TaxID=228776 RepID=A0ABD1B0L7_CARAN
MISSSEDSCVNTMGIRGFQEKYEFGRKIIIYTSKSKSNPGRPFYCCPTLPNRDHLFKWVEETVFEEVQDAFPKVECFETDICKSKVEFKSMKTVIEELMEEVRKTKNELKRLNLLMKVCFGSLGLIIMIMMNCVFLFMFGKKKLNFGSLGSNLSSF